MGQALTIILITAVLMFLIFKVFDLPLQRINWYIMMQVFIAAFIPATFIVEIFYKFLSGIKMKKCCDAIKEGNVGMVELFVNEDPKIAKLGNMRGYTLLHFAAKEGQEEIIKLLINKGADINALALKGEYNEGYTPLYMAAENGRKKAVDFLISNGVEIKKGRNVLLALAKSGQKEIMEYLIARGADVNVSDVNMGDGLLHIAAKEGHREICEFLINKGLDVNSKNWMNWGKTPIQYAKDGGHQDVVFLLQQHGAK